MTPRQQAFVQFYAACGNATEAARAAGYSARYVRENAPKILQKPTVQAALKALTEKISNERIADVKERQEFWTAVMRSKDKGFEGLEMRDRLKASELLGKAHMDFIDRKELTGANGIPLIAPDVQVIFVDARPAAD